MKTGPAGSTFPISRAMILAAGYSRRLQPLSLIIPKPALPVLNRPLIGHVMNWLAGFGIRDFAINLHHLPDQVRSTAQALARNDWRLRFHYERDEIRLTAGALYPFRDFLRDGPFILVNGKIVTGIDLHSVHRWHRQAGNLVTLVLVPNRDGDPHTHVAVDGDGEIQFFLPYRQAVERGLEPLAFTGIYVMEPEVLHYIPDRPYEMIKDLYPVLKAEGKPVRAMVAGGEWMEFSTLARYLQNSLRLLERRGDAGMPPGAAGIHPRSRLESSVVAGNCTVEAGARIRNSILLAGARVNREACLDNCIAGPGSSIPGGCRLEHSLILAADPAVSYPEPGLPLGNGSAAWAIEGGRAEIPPVSARE